MLIDYRIIWEGNTGFFFLLLHFCHARVAKLITHITLLPSSVGLGFHLLGSSVSNSGCRSCIPFAPLSLVLLHLWTVFVICLFCSWIWLHSWGEYCRNGRGVTFIVPGKFLFRSTKDVYISQKTCLWFYKVHTRRERVKQHY